MFHRFFGLLILLCFTHPAGAQTSEPLSKDVNGDGIVRVLAFGDSLTYGIGDESNQAPGAKAGYPDRSERLLGLPFDNEGVPGEQFTESGARRLLSEAAASNADYIIVMEGANDAFYRTPTQEFSRMMQRSVNALTAMGKNVVLMSLPTPCCDHAAMAVVSMRYSAEIRTIAAASNLPFVDLERVWTTTCESPFLCQLFNLPEGLHPNGLGYDAMSQAVAARFLAIDIFAPGGAAQLEQALGLAPGSVVVKPDPAVSSAAS